MGTAGGTGVETTPQSRENEITKNETRKKRNQRIMKKVLITGAGSYIGTSVEQWLRQWPGEYQTDTLDMRGDHWRKRDFSEYDAIFHVAGIAHADTGSVSEETKRLYYQVNTELAVETAEKAKREKAGQFIFMSSMIIYGKKPNIDKTTRPEPEDFYGDSKWQADQGIRTLSEKAFPVAVLRPPMIYGKGSKGNYPALAKAAKKLPVFPAVGNRRSMLYIENLCEFVRHIIDGRESGIFFPQNQKQTSTEELVRLIAETAGHKIWITRCLTPFVTAGKHLPGKPGALCRKAFGSRCYAPELGRYPKNYQIADLAESIKRTEAT